MYFYDYFIPSFFLLFHIGKDILHIYSSKVLQMIVKNEPGWEEMVPPSVAKAINEKCLFGHPCFLGKKNV